MRTCTSDCSDLIKCVDCGKRLCHVRDEKCGVDGHYSHPDGNFCIECHKKREAKRA